MKWMMMLMKLKVIYKVNNKKRHEMIWQHKKIIYKTKNGVNVLSLEMVEAILVKFNLVDNQYQDRQIRLVLNKSR